MKKIYLVAIITLLIFNSCKKEIKTQLPSSLPISEKQNSKIVFSKILAIAIKNEPELRSFIKNEAMKQFDNDNDVLFQMVKDEKIVSGKTFYQILSQYAISQKELDDVITSLPTLTIMVPELPNFTPSTWNVNIEIPEVAVSPENKKFSSINIYDSRGEITKIPNGSIPDFPVVVVKENERINVSINNIDKSPSSSILLRSDDNTRTSVFLTKDNMKFSFSNEAFNGEKTYSLELNNTYSGSNQNKISRIDRTITNLDGTVTNSAYPIDPRAIQSFEKNIDWQRDYVYYGLDPAAGVDKGKFNNRIVEHIVSIRMDDLQVDRITDHIDDPSVYETYYSPGPGREGGYITNWTDGYFDIRISILINAKNGAGVQLNKVISARGSDLYDITYKNTNSGGRPTRSDIRFDKLMPKDFYINEPIVAWNLENYGAAWKFIVSEYDPSEEIVTTFNETTKFAANFGYDIGFGETVKFGIKFGASLETTSSSTYQYKTTRGSDELGEGILEFGSPIILRKEIIAPDSRPTRPGGVSTGHLGGFQYITNEVSCGSINLSIEPRQI